jgi:hypothetical protein
MAASITCLLVGVFAIEYSIAENQPSTPTSNTDNASQVAEGVFGAVMETAAPSVVHMGVAAIILISLGFLVKSSGGVR